MAHFLPSQIGISDPHGMEAETMASTREWETGNEDISEFDCRRNHSDCHVIESIGGSRPTGRLSGRASPSWGWVSRGRGLWWRVFWRTFAKLLIAFHQRRGSRLWIQPGRLLSSRLRPASLWWANLWSTDLSTLSSDLSACPSGLCGSPPMVPRLWLVNETTSSPSTRCFSLNK